MPTYIVKYRDRQGHERESPAFGVPERAKEFAAELQPGEDWPPTEKVPKVVARIVTDIDLEDE